jgi:SAM-dependent methyltransferase
MTTQSVARSLKRAIFGSPNVPTINPTLAAMEHVFRAPPLTPELVAAIKLIAPHFQITTDDKYRKIWEADQNAACWAEYLALAPVLEALPHPIRILEIGPGLGRSLVFFSKKFGWADNDLHAYEGEGATTKYTMDGPRFEDSFCGNIGELRKVLAYNGIDGVTMHDAKAQPLAAIGERFDLIYSFYSIGFHWALEHFLDEILGLMNDGGTAIFTLAPDYRMPASVAAVPHRIVESRSPLTKRKSISLIVLRKPA